MAKYYVKQVITTADGKTIETEPQEVNDDAAGYIEYDSETATLTLGKNGDNSKVQIDNDSMEIVVDGNSVASFTGFDEGAYSGCNINTVNTETKLCGMQSGTNDQLNFINTSIGSYSRDDWVQQSWASVSCKVENEQPKIIFNAYNKSGSGSSILLDKTGMSVHGSLFVSDKVTTVENLKSALVDTLYPVGAIYLSTVSTSPATLFGGSWTQIKDTFLLAAGSSYSAGKTGGAATHTLTAAQMPSHSHGMMLHKSVSPWALGTTSSAYAGAIVINDADTSNGTISTYNTGSGQSHNNMPPYLTVYMWKRTA